MTKKVHILKRSELYELVWQMPRTSLSKQFGISDVAITKACKKAGIPVPPPGHWARKNAGKKVRQLRLPPRGPGANEEITLGGSRYGYGGYMSDEEIIQATPEPPVFEESIEEVRNRIKDCLGRVVQPRSLKEPHRLIAGLLEEDDEKRQKAEKSDYAYSWNMPLFDSPTEKRRLRIISGLFKAVSKCGAKPSISKDAKETSVKVGDEFVHLSLEIIDDRKKTKKKGRPQERFRFKIDEGWRNKNKEQYIWEDSEGETLEMLLRDIAEEVVLAGERHYRSQQEYRYEWLVERKEELEEKERLRIETEQREERERIEKLRQERIQLLLDEASAHRQACDIRNYIYKVLESFEDSPSAEKQEQIKLWAEWARKQADDLDPIVSGTFVIDNLQQT